MTKIPSLNTAVLFGFTITFIFIRAFDEYTQIVTRIIMPFFALISVVALGGTRIFNYKVFLFYFYLFIWSLCTIIVASNLENYLRYSQLFIGIIFIGLILEGFITKISDLYALFWGILVGTLGIIFQGLISGAFTSSIQITDDLSRAAGIADNANTFGSLIVMAALSASALVLRKKMGFILYSFISVVLTVAVLQTASRSSFIGYIMIQAYVIFKTYSSWSVLQRGLVFFSLFLVSLLGLGYIQLSIESFMNNTLLGYRLQRESSSSDNLRSGLIVEGLQMISRNPIVGVGSGNFTNNNKYGLYSHNDIIELFATLGGIGLLIYSVFLSKAFGLFKRLSKSKLHSNWIGSFGLFTGLLFLLQGLFKPLFIDILWMFMLMALIISSKKAKMLEYK